jgi:hypothetical protein
MSRAMCGASRRHPKTGRDSSDEPVRRLTFPEMGMLRQLTKGARAQPSFLREHRWEANTANSAKVNG